MKQQRCRRRRRVSGCLMINGTRCVTTIRLNLRRAGDGPALPQLVGTDTAVPIRGHAARKRGLLERGVTAAVIPHSSNQGRLSRGRRRRSRRSPPGSGTAAASCASFPARWRSPLATVATKSRAGSGNSGSGTVIVAVPRRDGPWTRQHASPGGHCETAPRRPEQDPAPHPSEESGWLRCWIC
jgi:hypothetical protein